MRLLTWRDIRAEKINRGKTWLKGREDFPEPKVKGAGRAGDLWDEADVDAWLERFVAQESAKAARRGEPCKTQTKAAPSVAA